MREDGPECQQLGSRAPAADPDAWASELRRGSRVRYSVVRKKREVLAFQVGLYLKYSKKVPSSYGFTM